MRNRVLSVGAAVIVIGAMMALTNCQNQTADQAKNAGGDTTTAMQKSTDKATADPVAKGKYLVTLGGCNDCHSPKKMTDKGPVPDESRLLSGQPAGEPKLDLPKELSPTGWMAACNGHMTAWAGPWGISYSANLTPDTATGLGSWDSQTFISSMRSGLHMGSGRQILPPMPWPYLAQLSDDDLSSIFAYLQSLKPVSNQVPEPIPPAGGGAPQEGGK